MPLRLRIRHLLPALLVVLAAGLGLAGSAVASVLSFSGAERPLAQDWASYSCQDRSRVRQVASPVAQGSRAYQVEVRDGDNSYGERCEIGMGNPGRRGFPLFHRGDERWVSFQVYLQDDYPLDTHRWNLFLQIHQDGDGGSPPIALGVQDGSWKMFNSTRNTYVLNTREMWSAPAQRGHWAMFTLHIKNSPDPGVGFVELLGDLDGQGERLLLGRTGTHTMTADSRGVAMVNHVRVGIYRDPQIQGTAHILFDGFTIATDQASAEAAAFGAGDAITEPAAPPAPVRTTARHRVWLRARTPQVSRAGLRHLLRLYGGVSPARGAARRSVTIQARVQGRWQWLATARVRRDGRFFVAVRVDPAATGPRVQLRAVVAGVGRSQPLGARV